MKRLLTILWSVQGLMFVIAGLSWMVAPTSAFLSLIPAAHGPHRIAVAAIRLLGPFAVATGLLTALGQMSARRVVAQQFAALFGLFLIPWCAVIYYDVYRQDDAAQWSSGALVFLLPGIVFMLLNALVGFFTPVPPEVSATGYHSTAPEGWWGFWLLQATLLVGVGVTLIVAPRVLVVLLAPGVPPNAIGDVTLAQYRTVGPYALSMGLFTLYGIGRTGWVELWTSMARIFGVLFGLLTISALLVYDPQEFTPWLPVIAAGFALLSYANFTMASKAPRQALEDSRRGDIGWTALDLVAGPLMAVQCFFGKRRASHLVGVGARGRFTVVSEAERRFPDNDFFVPGRELPLQMRFANLTERDDAALDVRGAAIKLSTEPAESPFDMVMNTGSFTPAQNIVEFAGFVASKFVPTFGSELIVKSNRPAREGGIAGLRRAPSSFADLHYYGQIVRVWFDRARRMHLVRYRVLGDAGTESGLPDAADCAHIWERGRRPDEQRATDYLRRELTERLRRGPVTLRFQAQFHAAIPGEPLAWYNAAVDWDEGSHPWVDLGRAVLEAALPDRETEVLQFNPGNQPPSFFTPLSDGVLDYRSMGDSEIRVMRKLAALRLWLYGALGLPRFEGGGEP